MSVWAFDGWPIGRFVSGLPGIADLLRTFPGAGPDVGYGPGQRFYDDLLQRSIDYAEAMDRADRTMAELVKTREPDPGVYVAWPISEQTIDYVSDMDTRRPAVIPAPRSDLGEAPPIGSVILVPLPQVPLPNVQERTAGGGIYLVPFAQPAQIAQPVPGLRGGVYVAPEPVVAPPPPTQTVLPGGIYLVPITTTIPAQQAPPKVPPGITLVPIGQTAPLPQLPPLPGPAGPAGPQGPPGPAGAPAVFPPELLAAIEAIKNVILDISSTQDSIAASLTKKLNNAAESILGRVQGAVDSITLQLGADLADITGAIGTTETHILGQLAADTAAIERTVQSSATAITAQISGEISNLAGGIEAAFSTGSRLISDSVDAIPGAIAGLKLDPMEVLDAVRLFGSAMWPSWINPLKTLVEAAVRYTADSMEADAVSLLGAMIDDVLNDASAPPQVRAIAQQLRQPQHFVVGLLLLPVLLIVAKAALEEPMRPLLMRWQHAINAATTPDIPSPQAGAVANRLRKIDRPAYLRLAAENGLSEQWAQMLLDVQEQTLSPEILLDLWRRKQITEAQFRDEMARQGFAAPWIDKVWELRYVEPPSSDVARFIIKDAYNDALSRDVGHDDEWDETKNLDAFQAAGVRERDALLLYRSAWQDPSRTEILQMFHRTTDASTDPSAERFTDDGESWTQVVGLESVRQGLRINDVPKLWRDRFAETSYLPLTRVDVRRMHKLGILTGPQVTRAYMDLGYSFANAKRLRAFTESLNNVEAKNESETFRSPVRTRVITDFLAGTISQETAERVLAGVGYDATDTAQWWPAALELREANQRAAIRDDVGRLFVDGFWTAEQALARLSDAGFDDDTRSHLIEDWELDRELKMSRDLLKEQRDLSKAEILEAYRDGISDRSSTVAFLVSAGYDDREAGTLVALQDARTERELRRLDVDAIHTQYTRGLVDRATASGQLDALGLPVRSRQAYLSRWDAEMRKAPPTLSDSEIRAQFLRGIIGTDGARKGLLGRGLRPDAVDQLLALWQSDRTIAMSKLSDTQIKRLVEAQTITRPEVVAILLGRGLSQREADRLARTFV